VTPAGDRKFPAVVARIPDVDSKAIFFKPTIRRRKTRSAGGSFASGGTGVAPRQGHGQREGVNVEMDRSRRTPQAARRRGSSKAPGPHEVPVPKLPHERDETPDPAPGSDGAKVRRAAADIAARRKDTDCYGAARRVFDRAARGRRR
jgi:hypothetical protein